MLARDDLGPENGRGAGVPAGGQTEAVLEIADFSVAYRTLGGDVRAVDHVNLSLRPGEVVGLAGESGSGKSTLAYGACRLLRAPAVITGGSVIYRGRRLPQPVDILSANKEGLRALRWREIAIVFQSAMNALNPVLNVRDQLVDVIDAHMGLNKREAVEKAASLLDFVSIPRTRLKSYPHELSGGMRQRVMIAMALATDPEVVIMDEPTTALDVVVQRDILSQVVELKDQLGFAVLFITHDLSLLLELANRVAVMYAGKLVEVGTSSEMHHEPAHPYTKGLLNSFPSLRGPRRELTGIPGSPPDLRALPPGCSFLARCRYGTEACQQIDMVLAHVATSADPDHVTACPFVLPGTPVPFAGGGGPQAGHVGAAQPGMASPGAPPVPSPASQEL
jgi:oligopeptide/dipeptide ABC transporter ATP-binding protein